MYPPVGPPPRRTPGTVIGLRIIVGPQLAGVLAVLVSLVVVVGFAGAGLDSSDDLTRGFAGLGVFLGIIGLVLGLVVAAALGVPLILIRGGRARGCTASLIVLVVVEGIAVLLGLLATVAAAVDRNLAAAGVQLVFALVPAGAIVLAMVPVTRAWAAAPPVATWGGPPPPAGPGYPPPGPWTG